MQISLKAARINARLTRREAAKTIGVSLNTLGNYENGLSYPNAPTIKNIERVYSITYDDIDFLCPLKTIK